MTAAANAGEDPATTDRTSIAAFEGSTPWVRRWLRAEGLAILGAAGASWLAFDFDWPWFFILLLVPDISMVGYLRGPHVGAILYNLAHNLATGLAVLGVGLGLRVPAVTLAGLILLAHVGMDRAFGYGLKYPTSFQDTHLGRIGKAK